MAQTSSLIWLLLGASLVGVVTRVVVPPATWIALTLLLHASRPMPVVPGMPYVWLALYVALAIGNRGIIPADGQHTSRSWPLSRRQWRFRSPSIGWRRPALAASD
jgi:hypothetical protein